MVTAPDAGEMTALGRKTPAADMPRAAILLRWIVAGVGLLTLLALLAVDPPDTAALRYLVLFVAAFVVAESLLLVRIAPGSHFSIAPAFLFVYFSIGGAAGAAAAAAAGNLIVWMIGRLRGAGWQTPHFVLFNIGQQILSLIFAGAIVQFTLDTPALTGPVTRAPAASIIALAFAYVAMSTVFTSLSVYALSGFAEVRQRLWPTTTVWVAISVAVSVPFAIVNRLLAPELGGYVRATLFTFAVLAGIALVVKLNVNLRAGNNELRTINTIGRLITATLELPEIFGIVARESRNVLFWDGFFIALGDRDSEAIQLVFLSEQGTELARRKIPRGAGLTGKVIATGNVAQYDQSRDSRQRLAQDDSFRGSRRPRSVAIVPMKFGDEVIGAISVQSFQSDAYGPPQIRLLQTIAGQTAIAVRNAQLFESEKRAKNERDEFLSLVTHEIKNPLTSVRGYAALAEQSARGGDVEATVEAIKVIEGESGKILRLTEDLLDASRMTAGRFAVRKEPLDLSKLVAQITRRYEITATQTIRCTLPDRCEVEGDPIRLSQVVENLLSNALKYSPAGTTVEILLRREIARAVLSVRDEGSGIPPEQVPYLFERFYRVEEEGSTVKGTGLGLFISREIVRMHGGDISVESTPGRGSVFTIELPAKA
jgi:signal transduction histidine kinase